MRNKYPGYCYRCGNFILKHLKVGCTFLWETTSFKVFKAKFIHVNQTFLQILTKGWKINYEKRESSLFYSKDY